MTLARCLQRTRTETSLTDPDPGHRPAQARLEAQDVVAGSGAIVAIVLRRRDARQQLVQVQRHDVAVDVDALSARRQHLTAQDPHLSMSRGDSSYIATRLPHP